MPASMDRFPDRASYVLRIFKFSKRISHASSAAETPSMDSKCDVSYTYISTINAFLRFFNLPIAIVKHLW
jgi:hypothetical protein